MKAGDKVRLVIDGEVVGTNTQYNWMNVRFGNAPIICVPMRDEPGLTIGENAAQAPGSVELLASHVAELAGVVAKTASPATHMVIGGLDGCVAAAAAIKHDIENTDWRQA